jgi:hypothetical protein
LSLPAALVDVATSAFDIVVIGKSLVVDPTNPEFAVVNGPSRGPEIARLVSD